MTPQQALAQRISTRQVAAAELAGAFKVSVSASSHPKTGQVALPNGLFRVPGQYAGRKCDFRCDPVDKRDALLVIDDERQIRLKPFTIKRAFAQQQATEKRGTGQLQKLLDLYQGRSRPIAQPGFGLPEVFREMGRLLKRAVPIDQSEATAIEAFYRKNGPLPAKPFAQAIDTAADALGAGRPLKAYLQYLERLIQAHKQNPNPENMP